MQYEHTRFLVDEMKGRLLIMQLFLEGHPIEWQLKHEGIWRHNTLEGWEPSWDWDVCDYRIKKPERRRKS